MASISGTTITIGAGYALTGAAALVNDVATGANLYVVGSTSYAKLSISGTTVTAAYTVASVPIVVFSDTLTDKAVNYAGTWYNWTGGVPAPAVAISASKYITTASWPTLNFVGGLS